MPTRQKQLLIGLAAAVLLWQGSAWVHRLVLEPLEKLRAELATRQERVDDKENQWLAIELSKGKIAKWQQRCLSPDPGRKARPDAVEGQRQYTVWLTELVRSIGFDEVAVTPQRRSVSRNNVYVEAVVQIDGEGKFSQLCELLDRLYRTDVLQRLGRLQIVAQDVIGDPPVRFTFEASALALALPDTPPRRTMFARTVLSEDAEATAPRITVATVAEFPKKTPFRVRLDRELLDVTSMDGTSWTVTRGVERTDRAEHPANASLVLVPIRTAVSEFSRQEFHEFIRTNIFAKPTPPVEYDFRFGPFSPPIVVRGRSWEYSIAATNFDPARGDPKYRFQDKAPRGLSLNEETGQLLWKPDGQVKAGDYPLTVEVRHPSASGGKEEQSLTLILAEPNTAPKFPALGQQTVYRGQPWRFFVTANDSDLPAQKLSYKLPAGAPPGSQIDPATGELRWTPGEEQPLGPVVVSVTASDNGTPPQSSTASVSVNVQDDAAKQTIVIGIVGLGDEREVWFGNKSTQKKTVLRIGEELRVADIAAKIVSIAADAVTVLHDKSELRLKLGDTVRSLTTSPKLTPSGSAETPR